MIHYSYEFCCGLKSKSDLKCGLAIKQNFHGNAVVQIYWYVIAIYQHTIFTYKLSRVHWGALQCDLKVKSEFESLATRAHLNLYVRGHSQMM